jgi:hypothetical protein
VSDSLLNLAQAVANRIAELEQTGILRRQPGLFLRMTLEGFRYDEHGPAWSQARWSSEEKESWGSTALTEALRAVEAETDAATQALPAEWGVHPRTWIGVERLFQVIALRVLEGNPYSDAELQEQISLLERSIREEPVRVFVRADISGLAILTQAITLQMQDVRIRLRAAMREDFEEEQLIAISRLGELRRDRPTSAILELEYEAQDASGWQRELDRAVTLLQLFGTGDVGYTLVEFGSDSFIEIGGGVVFFDDGTRRPRTYALRLGDPERLRQFFDVMSRVLPQELYWGRSDDPQGLAGSHFWYKRALGRRGWVNEQTAEVIRVLESLLMRGKGKQISATLRARTSALLGACGFDAREVDRTLGLAYEVRSRYVHGEPLAESDEARIRKQAGDVVTLFRRCLDYLRLALVAAIAAGVDKDSLIAAVDAAKKGRPRALERIGDAFRAALPS